MLTMRKDAIAFAVILCATRACSVNTNVGVQRQGTGGPVETSSHVDHFVPHISTDPANKNDPVKLFLRERVPVDARGPVVLFVHGRSTFAVPAFDLAHRGYSWMDYLARAGFDVFAMDLQGYGGSSKPRVMDEPCNTSRSHQIKYLIPNPLAAPCPPTYPHSFGSFRTDWDEIDSTVEFIRALRRDGGLKVNLIGWSRGGMRVIGYAALHPDKIERVVAYAPTRFPPPVTDRAYPTNLIDKAGSFVDWDRQRDATNCPDQFDPAIRDLIWDSTMELDKPGSRWGTSGISRSPSFDGAAGWTADLPGMLLAPTLVIRGSLDDQAPEAATRALYESLRAPKVYVTVRCGSHELQH
jgi:pimeloyl-ACP methyl ester carboxylesterase